MNSNRKRYEYHHLGIPTNEVKPNERYLDGHHTYVSGYEESAYGIEWMRFEEGCTLPEVVQRVPHVAFRVDDVEKEIEGKEVIIPPNSPSKGVKVAFIIENGAPVEFIEIDEEE